MEHSIKLSGKFNVEFAPHIDKDYEMRLTGSISSIAKTSNEDGTFSYTYSLKPLYGEILNDKGETVKVVKKGSQSQKLRATILNCGLDYEQEMTKIIDSYDN
jgi:hypothetical protein